MAVYRCSYMDLMQVPKLNAVEEPIMVTPVPTPAKSRSGRPLRNRLGRQVLPGRMRQKKKILQGMTKILKRWLIKNKTNPYPTPAEKKQLAFASQMSMVQVSNWFANARRRVKNTVKDSDADWGTRIKMYNNFKSGNADPLSSDSSSSCYTDDSDADSLPDCDGPKDVLAVTVNFEDHCYSAPEVAAAASVTHSSTSSSASTSSGLSTSTTGPSPNSSQAAATSSTIIQLISSTSGRSTPHDFRHPAHHRQQLDAKHIPLSEYLARRCHKRAREPSDEDDDVNTLQAECNNNNTNGSPGDPVKSEICRPKKYKKRMLLRFLNEPQDAASPNHLHHQPQQSTEQFQYQNRLPVHLQQPEEKGVSGCHSVETSSEGTVCSPSTSHSPSSPDSNQAYPNNGAGELVSYTPIYINNNMHPPQSLPNEQQWNKLDAAIVLATMAQITSTNNSEDKKRRRCWNQSESSPISKIRSKKLRLASST